MTELTMAWLWATWDWASAIPSSSKACLHKSIPFCDESQPTLKLSLIFCPLFSMCFSWASSSLITSYTVVESVSQAWAIELRFICLRFESWDLAPWRGSYICRVGPMPGMSSFTIWTLLWSRNDWYSKSLTTTYSSWSILRAAFVNFEDYLDKESFPEASYLFLTSGLKTPIPGNSITLRLTVQTVLIYLVTPLQTMWSILRAFLYITSSGGKLLQFCGLGSDEVHKSETCKPVLGFSTQAFKRLSSPTVTILL